MKRLTQKELAGKLNLSQPEYSKIEQKEAVEDGLLERIAFALEVTPEIIREFRDDAIFTNHVYDQNNSINQVYFQFNPLEKIIELYEQVIRDKDEIIEMLRKNQKAS